MRDIEKLQDGQKGVVFKITDDSGQVRILKLQAENPARAIVGTHLLMRAGVETPVMEPAVGPKLDNLMGQGEQFLQQSGNQDHEAANNPPDDGGRRREQPARTQGRRRRLQQAEAADRHAAE